MTPPDPTEDALRLGILLAPGDDTARLVYADWCDENDRPDYAEFVRVQVELAGYAADRFRGPGRTPGAATDDRYWELRDRELELWKTHAAAWFVHLKDVVRLVQIGNDHPDEMTVLNFSLAPICTVERGFVAAVSCPNNHTRHGVDLLTADVCRACDGTGTARPGAYIYRITSGGDLVRNDTEPCKMCDATGRSLHGPPPLAPVLFGAEPVTRVDFPNCVPVELRPGVWEWHRYGTDLAGDHLIPGPVFDRLPAGDPGGDYWAATGYALAKAGLAAAAADHGRSRAAGRTHRVTCGTCEGGAALTVNQWLNAPVEPCATCHGGGTVARPGLPPLHFLEDR